MGPTYSLHSVIPVGVSWEEYLGDDRIILTRMGVAEGDIAELSIFQCDVWMIWITGFGYSERETRYSVGLEVEQLSAKNRWKRNGLRRAYTGGHVGERYLDGLVEYLWMEETKLAETRTVFIISLGHDDVTNGLG